MQFCEARTRDDLDFVVNRVMQGDHVVVHAGGMRRPRRGGINAPTMIGVLGRRMAMVNGELLIGPAGNTLSRALRGQTVVVRPRAEPGDEAGVREPRRPDPPSLTDRVA